ncbi:MAG: hypothetical protein VX768_11560 [Planctomycetota bacterium]|nr:hypothetical protein [Planctomycetota bacterium]
MMHLLFHSPSLKTLLITGSLVLPALCGCTGPGKSDQDSNSRETTGAESANRKEPTGQTGSQQADSPGGLQQMTAKNLIDAHIEATGGAATIKKIRSYRRSSSVRTTAPTGNSSGTIVEAYDLAGDQGRVDLTVVGFEESKGWQKQKGWRKNTFQPLRDSNDIELSLDKIAMPISILFSIKEIFGNAAFKPPSPGEFNGKECHKVNIVNNPMEVFLNSRTKLIEGIFIPGFLRISFSEYTEKEGVQIPYQSRVEVLTSKSSFSSRLEKIEFNLKLDGARFSKP